MFFHITGYISLYTCLYPIIYLSQYKIYTAQVRPPSASLTIQEKEEIAVQYSGCEFPFHTQFGILTQTT